MSQSPLNPHLYRCLSDAVKAGVLSAPGNRIKIVHPGRETVLRYSQDPLRDMNDPRAANRWKYKVTHRGEAYDLNCPFCKEQRGRLSIDHLWNTPDPTTGGPRLFLCNCYNEGCLPEPENVQRLINILHPYRINQMVPARVRPKAGYISKSRGEVRPPGPMVPLDQLAPTHPANIHLLGRKHNPVLLAQQYGVSYCTYSSMPFAAQRIIFPVYLEGKLIGWQARYVDEDGNGDCSDLYYCEICRIQRLASTVDPATGKRLRPRECPNCKNRLDPVPKYWTSPGFNKSEHLMNYDVARQWPYVVLVEGPLDGIRVGAPQGQDLAGPACPLFGKTLGPFQKKRIVETWHKGHVVVLLDADAYDATVGGTTNVVMELKGMIAGGVLPVLLPDGRDPGETDHNLIWELIYRSAEVAGMNLPRP